MRPFPHPLSALMRPAYRVLAVTATLVVAAAMSALISSGPAYASTLTSSCSYGSSGDNLDDCIIMDHSGTYVDTVKAQAKITTSCRTIKEILSGPNGTIKATGWAYVCPTSSNNPLYVTWKPYSTEPAGYYCATADRLNSDGTVTQVARACIYIG